MTFSVTPRGNYTQSRNQTQRQTDEEKPVAVERLVLRLRKPPNRRGVRFTEDTVDNEHMGKKKSKSCCIYHPPSDDEDDGCDRKNPHQCSAHQS